MNSSASKGNNPELWEKLLNELDEKLQLGLLDRLRRVASYHFEDETLFIEPGTKEDERYLCKEAVLQQFKIFATEIVKVERVKIKPL